MKQPSEKALVAAREWLIKNVAPANPTERPPFVGYKIASGADAVEGFALALDAFAAEAVKAEREACELACIKDVPRAHTYASENADYYRAGDAARHACIAAIRARGKE